eukprot:TRINITY_DN11337_c0_g1_i1.p1 TRINITY_DN11337_c0_g1~~TRINITY_DN11337_c0_g1_i1.p1  ORF type:complete len:753 (-),score=77.35 TRINITY_DN11337_c0_g1_i1:28-2169(-)
MPDCAHDLGALHAVVDANSLSGDGALSLDEVKQTLRCLGFYPSESEFAVAIEELHLSFPLHCSDIENLAQKLDNASCQRGLLAVPYSRRGMYLHQLKSLCEHVVDSGWLTERCICENATNAAGLQDEKTFHMEENLYALDRFFIRPVTSTDARLRIHVQPSILAELRISVPRYECCYSQLVNPDGIIVNLFVSHFWGHPLVRTVDALEKYVSQISRIDAVEAGQPEEISFWICAFALNQHCVENELGSSPETAPFNVAIAKATIGVAMVMDASAEPLRRIWCLFEVARARELGKLFHLVDDDGLRGEGRPSSLFEEKTAQLAEKIQELSAFEAAASVADDTVSIWYRIQNPATRKLLPDFAGYKQAVINPLSKCVALNKSDFSEFDTALKRLLASPLLAAAAKADVGQDALRYVGMGADCDVSQLIALENQGADLQSWIPFRHADMAGDAQLVYIFALAGKSEEVRFLLSRGAAANLEAELSPGTSMSGSTPLHAAVKHGNVETVSILLEYRANVNAKTSDGLTPIYFCASRSANNMEKARLLLDRKANLDSPRPLWSAATSENTPLISLLLDRKCSVNVSDNTRVTALHIASRMGFVSVVSVLLERSANIAVRRREDGGTPLHRAAAENRKAVATLLLARQADPASRDYDGRTPSQIAAAKGYADLASLLKEYEGRVAPKLPRASLRRLRSVECWLWLRRRKKTPNATGCVG